MELKGTSFVGGVCRGESLGEFVRRKCSQKLGTKGTSKKWS